MSSLQEAKGLRQQLIAEWKQGKNPNLEKCGELLNRLKTVLTNLTFLPESTERSSRDEMVIARDVLEIGAFWSIQKKDIPSFERYMAQLKCYYMDFKAQLPESSFKCELLGLNLLCLLSQNRVAEFHTELELFAHPDLKVLENVYIKHAVSMEQFLMEGRYNKIFLAKKMVPAEEYTYFIDILLDTIRDEIATCVEKSYGRLHEDSAAKALNMNEAQLKAYASKRKWVLGKDRFYTFLTEHKQDDRIPSYELAKDSIEYAKELEMIV